MGCQSRCRQSQEGDQGGGKKLSDALRWQIHTAPAYEAAVKQGKFIVELEPPELLPGLSEWLDDFFELSTDRQIGMVAGPIPKASIDRHVEGWSHDEADMFRACMRAMDSVYLSNAENGPEQTQSDNPARD